jgi:adenylate cyclase
VPSRDRFAQDVISSFNSYSTFTHAAETALSKSVRASGATGRLARPMGHPDFAGLPLGTSDHCDAAVVFLDLAEFTARTFWDSPESVVYLAQAVLTQLTEVVIEMGGHPLGLRGDGLFACFGGPASVSPGIDIGAALGACAFALDATESALNNMLTLSGIDPVRLRAGADYGRLDFVQTGTDGASEVNVIGFAANFAAKCEKKANSWELVVGEGLAAHVGNAALLKEHEDSPKTYQRNYVPASYKFYDVRWRSLVPHTAGVGQDLAGSPISSVHPL